MFGLHAHDKKKYMSTNTTKFGGGRPLPEYSKINPLVYLCVINNFIDNSINALAKTFP